MSHKTSCFIVHLQTLCLKTSTIFFLIKCSFLQRINRGAAGLLGAETIISSKNSDFQKQKCTFKMNYCCTMQNGSGHLSRNLSFHRFPKARVHFQNKLYTIQNESGHLSTAVSFQKCISKKNYKIQIQITK